MKSYPAEKQERIRRKLAEKECGICLETCEVPTLSPCCCHLYCGKCLLTNAMIRSTCPLCRKEMPIHQVVSVSLDGQRAENTPSYATKMETCLSLFQNHPDGKWLVFSTFDNLYYQMAEKLASLGIKAGRLESQFPSFLKTVKSYTEGDMRVLFVSNLTLLRGLSLACTTHLIFYHVMDDSCSEKQLLIHSAQRMPRKTPLNIVHLKSEFED